MPVFTINLYEACVKVVSGETQDKATLIGYAMRNSGKWDAWRVGNVNPLPTMLVLTGSFKTRQKAIDAIVDGAKC